jgi:hypothetical protein
MWTTVHIVWTGVHMRLGGRAWSARRGVVLISVDDADGCASAVKAARA